MKSDARVRYTKMMIRNSFIDLLRTKPVSKITVTEICEAAQINRATFYKYYADVYDLLDKIEEELYEQYKAHLGNLERDGLRETLVKILTGFKENFGEYMAIFGKDRNGFYLQRKIMQTCYDLFSAKLTYPHYSHEWEKRKAMVYSYVSAGTGGIIACWCQDEMKEPPEDIAQLIETLIHSTMKGLR